MTTYVRTYEIPNHCMCATCGFLMRIQELRVPIRGNTVNFWCENAMCSDKDLFIEIPMRVHEIEIGNKP